MKKQENLSFGADSDLAQMVNWDTVEAPEEPKKEEVKEEKEESSLKDKANDDEKPSAEVEKTEEKTETEDGEQQSKEEVSKEETPAEEPKTEEPQQPDLEAIRAEVRKQVEQEYQSKAPKFANETIEKLNELALAGVDVNSNDFWTWQSIDLDRYNPQDKDQALTLRQLELETENPDLSKEEVQRLLKRQYKTLLSGDFDSEDEEYQEALLDLKIDAKRSVTKLKQHKQKVQLPKVDLAAQEKAKEEAQKAREAFNMETKKYVNQYKEQPIKLDENLEVKFQVSNEARKFAESAIVNNERFFMDNYVNDKGVDMPRLVRDMSRLADYDAHIKAAYEQGVSVVKEAVVDELENADESVSQRKQETFKSYEEQIAEQLAARNKRR